MELTQLRTIIEGALLAAGQPLNLNRLKGLFEEEDAPENDDIRAALEAIATDCEGRGFELKEVGSGWRFQVRPETAPWVNRLWEEKPQKYSRALLETLALVAYRQPITRGDIEEIRGVAVSSHIIKTLTEREWVKAVGHRDVPGRPALYATTRQFLDYFNLKSLDELPSLGEIRDLNDINAALDLDGNDADSNRDDSDTETDDKPADERPEADASEGLEPSAEEQEPSADEPQPSSEEPEPQGEEPEPRAADDSEDAEGTSESDAETQSQSPDSPSEREPNTEAKPSSL